MPEPRLSSDLIPTEDAIFSWIEEVFSHGVRRPGYPADRWAEEWSQQQFRTLGLENVRAEPVELPYWEPLEASLYISAGGVEWSVPCFPLPHAAPTSFLEGEVISYDVARPELVAGAISLCDVVLNRLPERVMKSLATWSFDPDGFFDSETHILPFGREIQHVMEASVKAGAAGFIGVLRDYPGDSFEYYVPYDALDRPIPGVWVSGSEGQRIRDALSRGPVRARLTVESRRETITCHNIAGELPGG
jgi:hypothetical protein